jgi:alpha-beta hydrolase superfamily lysophospholipase
MKGFIDSGYFDFGTGARLYVKCTPCIASQTRGNLIISHGLAETAEYYDEFSSFISAAGYNVAVPELRGHGRTAGDITDSEYKNQGGHPGPDSLNGMANDLRAVSERIKKETGKPVFLLGHSMGSVAAQLCVMRSHDLFAGTVLMGVPDPGDAQAMLDLVSDEIRRNGPNAECHDTFLAMFGNVDAPFRPVRTAFDWITSDEKMADYSAALPNSAVLFCNSFYYDFLSAILVTSRPESWKEADNTLPFLLLSGGDDVITVKGKSITALAEMLVSAGNDNIELKIYPGLRHSILREKKRRSVFGDILRWLDTCNAV